MDEGMSGFRIKAGGDGGNGGEGGVEGTKCGRWNPTEEQVKVLTDLFMSGLRTPSTDQIQRISSQLSFYGKIESKNIFYWFQNHKARERQKRRRVSVEKRDPFDRVDKVFPAKHFKEVEQISEPERAIKTLQLFPVNSNEESESEKLRFFRNEYKDQMTAFSCAFGKEIDHPQLDLRLSFL